MNDSKLLQEILNIPWAVVEYQRWLEKEPSPRDDDYLFAQPRIRFEPADDDRLLLLDSAVTVEHEGAVGVRPSNEVAPIVIPSMKMSVLKALVEVLRRRPQWVEVPFLAGVPGHECDRLMRAGFGRFVFAPEAVAALEQHASASEIVRFPASPYEIVRNYWKNVGRLSINIAELIETSVDRSSFVTWLREGHVKLLLGADFNAFYRPSSPIARYRVMPGALYVRPTRVVTTGSGVFIVDGPRINATPVGGTTFHRLLERSLRTGNSEYESMHSESEGESWGAVIKARSRGDERDSEWFVPPRPMDDAHFEALWEAWDRALSATREGAVDEAILELGRFHWRFVRLHPFACANQSLAFALVNRVLRELLGCGIPQLILDQVALRHRCLEYTRLFGRAVTAWRSDVSSGLERQKERIRKRQVLDRGVAAIASAQSDAEAERFLQQNPEVAELALLSERGTHGET